MVTYPTSGHVTFQRAQRNGTPFEVLIDACDVPIYERHAWQRHTKGLIRYNGKNKGQGSILLHREILGVGPELYVLQRNGNISAQHSPE